MRRPRAPARLRWRLVGLSLLLLAAALTSVGVVQYLVLRGYVLERTYDAVMTEAAITGKLTARTDSQAPPVPGSLAAVYDTAGRPLVLPERGTQPWLEPGAARVTALAPPAGDPPFKPGPGKRQRSWQILSSPAGEVMLSVTPLQEGQLMVIESPLADVDALLQADLLIYAAVAGTALVATGGLAVWLTSRALAPLERVAGVAREVSQGAYERRANLTGDDEVARLGAAFDEMVERLQERIRQERASEARMRRFLADASHELRTPVSGILGHVEVLRRGALDSRADLEESLAAMHGAALRMTRLVGDLLTLARFEQADAGLRSEPLDAGSLLSEAVRAARSSTGQHRVEMQDVAGDLAVAGDRDAVERILVNLLDNAAKYSPAGTEIRVAARRAAGDRVQLLVADGGPGIPPGERERIFERLYRGDRSRAAGANQGAGLGLAICRALARAQGGDVTVRDAPGGGAVFVVTLPAAPQRAMARA